MSAPRFEPFDDYVFTMHPPDDPDRPWIDAAKSPGGVVCQTLVDGEVVLEQRISAAALHGPDHVLELMADYSGETARRAWDDDKQVELRVFDGDDGRCMFLYRMST